MLLGQEDTGREEPLIGCARGIVALDHLAADAVLTDELAHGPEEVELESQQAIETLEDRESRARAITVIPDETADDEAVALLDPRLIVLAIRPPPRTADVMAATPLQQVITEELTAIV